MKVIHFVAAIDRSLGGVSIYMQLLAKELGKLVDLLVVTRRTAAPLKLENCRVRFLPLPMSEISEFRKEWISILAEEQPDVVHVNGIWMLHTWIVQREALRLGVCTCITTHGMLEPWIVGRHRLKKMVALLLFQRRALREAEALVATAESEKDNILKLGYNPNVCVIANGIDVDGVNMKTSWKRTYRVLFLSRVHVKKGIEMLIEAVAKLGNELKTYEVVVAGEGEAGYVETLKDKVAAAGMGDMVRFVGGVYGEDKWSLLRSADVLVLPTFSENFGIVVAEALACGTPVVTTKGAPWGDLEAWGCGWWIERDVDSLVAAMKDFLALTGDELERMGRMGRRLVEAKYSSRRMAADMLALYRRLPDDGKTHCG